MSTGGSPPARRGAGTFTLAPDKPFVVSGTSRIALVRAAIGRHPERTALREQLAFLLFADDDFDGAIALFEDLGAERSDAVLLTLNDAYLSRRAPGDDRRAEEAARLALATATDDGGRAAALAALGKSLVRQDRTAEARAALTEALALAPHHVDAYKRLAAIAAGDGASALEAVAAPLIAQGVAHAQLLAGRAAALAMADRIDEARAMIGLDRFLHRRIVAPPPGWPTLAAFNDALARELVAHPDVRYDRVGAASAMTWRVERPLTARSIAVAALQETIRDAVLAYVERTADDAVSPWLRARPAAASLHLSCVMTDADGFEHWHMHQHSWLSGVYYVDVPPHVVAGEGREGCLAFGLPDDVAGADVAAAYGERIVRPEPGLLLLFPSHAHHRTFAHGGAGRRICVAFDVRPA